MVIGEVTLHDSSSTECNYPLRRRFFTTSELMSGNSYSNMKHCVVMSYTLYIGGRIEVMRHRFVTWTCAEKAYARVDVRGDAGRCNLRWVHAAIWYSEVTLLLIVVMT
jgi:hypothetical protein